MKMPSLRNLLTRARDTTPVPLAAAVMSREAAEAERGAARAAIAEAERTYRFALLNSDADALRAHAQVQADANRRLDVANALIEAFDAQIAEAKAAEQDVRDAETLGKVEGVVAKANDDWAAYRNAIQNDVPAIRSMLQALAELERVAEHSRKIAIKAVRDAGDIEFSPLCQDFLNISGRPAKRLHVEVVELWTDGYGEPMSHQDKVSVRSDGSGYLRVGSASTSTTLRHRRQFKRIEELPETSASRGAPPLSGVWAELLASMRGLVWPGDPSTEDMRQPVTSLVPLGPVVEVTRKPELRRA